MNSWHTLLIAWSSSRTFSLISRLRLLQILLLRLHDILFHSLKSQLSSIAYRHRHHWSRRSHARCFSLFTTFVFNPAIYFGLYFPCNLSLNDSLILFPFQKAFWLPFIICNNLRITLDLFLLLILFRICSIWFWNIIIISLWLACHRPLSFFLFGIWLQKTFWKSTFWNFFKSFLLLFLCFFNGLARIIFLSLLKILSVFLLGDYFLGIFVWSNSILFPLLSQSFWYHGLLWRTFWNILAQSLFNHIFKVVFRRNNLRIRVHLFWWLIRVKSESWSYIFGYSVFLYWFFLSDTLRRFNWHFIYVEDLLVIHLWLYRNIINFKYLLCWLNWSFIII